MPQKREDAACAELPDIADVLDETEAIIRQCFKEFQLHEVFLSFNGGKDCTVLLDITIKILQEIYTRDSIAQDLKVVYIRSQGPFKEIEEFVKYIEKHYNIKLIVFEGEMKNTLKALIEEDGRLKAALMGTRRTDPYSSDLNIMTKTDASWPQLMRVFPLLNWSYHQIWSYLLKYKVPYCNLYDKGYTSIGSVQNTWPNPSLAYKNCCGCLSYYPAWRLKDPTLERAGRSSQAKTNGHNAEHNGHNTEHNGHNTEHNGHNTEHNGHNTEHNGHNGIATTTGDV